MTRMAAQLLVIDTRTHEVKAFYGRDKITQAKFDQALSAEEVEYMRKYPQSFIDGTPEESPETDLSA